MLKALRNFSCNSVKKQAGQTLDSFEVNKIREFKDKLISEGILEEKRDQGPIIIHKPRKKRISKKKV